LTERRYVVPEVYPKIFLYRRLVQAKLFIDAHYAENIDLENIADEAYFSKFHFIRQFKSIYRKTPHQYLISVKIENAKAHLKAGRPVAEVCDIIGFESLSSFSGLFKRLVGTTPSAYLKHHREIRDQIKESPLKYIPGCFAEKRGWL
jgi:AraC-like DNA-binding protein